MSLPPLDDARYVADQYEDSGNLGARRALHARFGTNPVSWHDWLWEQLAMEPEEKVLEVGAGTAALWDDVPLEPALAVLTDLSAGMAARASQGRSERFRFAVCDAQALPFADDSFDRVIANHMLYHVPDMDRALAEFARVLRAGGSFCAAANSPDHLHELHDLVGEYAGGARSRSGWQRFGLHNGRELVAGYFDRVTVAARPNPLEVTDAGAIVAYLESFPNPLDGNGMARLRRRLEREIDDRGAIRITSTAGAILARGR